MIIGKNWSAEIPHFFVDLFCSTWYNKYIIKITKARNEKMKMKISEMEMNGVQQRASLNMKKVKEYANLMAGGFEFPPVTIFVDVVEMKKYLADGYHRVEAAKMNKMEEIEVIEIMGTLAEAIIFNITENAKQGLPMTNAEKKRAVWTLINMPEMEDKSDREIGRICGVDGKTVGKYRKYKEQGKDPFAPKTASNGKKGSGKAKEEKIDTEKEAMKEEIARLKKENADLKAKIKKMELADTNTSGNVEFNKKTKNKLTKLIHPDTNQSLTREELLKKMEEATKILNNIKM